MVIRQLILKNFGKFKEKKIAFAPGINLIYGENESGKTTLHTFIKSIFFGLKKQRGRASKNDVYSHYEPWENEQYYAGTIRFSCDGKIFRLDRNFQRVNPKAALVCETDGEQLSISQGDLEMLLGNISEVVYDNTISVGQMKSQTEEGLLLELKDYIANYQGSNDGSLNLVQARNYLRDEKKKQDQEIVRQKQSVDEKKREILSKMEYLKNEITLMQEKQEPLIEEIRDMQGKTAILKEKYKKSMEQFSEKASDNRSDVIPGTDADTDADIGTDADTDMNTVRGSDTEREKDMKEYAPVKYPGKVFALVTVLILALEILLFSKVGNPYGKFATVLLGIVTELCVLLFLQNWKNKKNRRLRNRMKEQYLREKPPRGQQLKQKQSENEELIKCKKMLETYRQTLQKLVWTLENSKEQEKEKQTQMENFQADLQELENQEFLEMEEEKNVQAINLAMHTIEKLSLRMQNQVGEELRIRTSRILGELTAGKYTRLQIDEGFKIGVYTENQYVKVEQLSRGTIEQVYFSFRMAISEILCREEKLPIMLDDVFAMYDENRLKQVLTWLAGTDRQILLFTCHTREELLLKELYIPYNKIAL